MNPMTASDLKIRELEEVISDIRALTDAAGKTHTMHIVDAVRSIISDRDAYKAVSDNLRNGNVLRTRSNV